MDALLNISMTYSFSSAPSANRTVGSYFQSSAKPAQQQGQQDGTQSVSALQSAAVTEDVGSVQISSTKSVVDSYTPADKQEAAGLYRVGTDEDGNAAVYFDAPQDDDTTTEAALLQSEKTDDTEKDSSAAEDNSDDQKTTMNTDRVDNEIDQLKTKERQLALQLEMASDSQKDAIQRQITQIENELLWKDTDTYRQEHAVIS